MGWMRSCSVPSHLWCFWVLVDPASPSCCWTTQRWWGIGSHFWHFYLKGARWKDTASCFNCLISYGHNPDPSNYIKNHQVLLSLFWFCAHLWNHRVRSQMIAQLPLRRLSSFVSVASGPPVAVGQGDPCHVASHLRSALWQGVEKTSCGDSILFNPIQPFRSLDLFWRLSLPWASALELSCGGDLDNWNGATRFLDFSAVLGQLMAFCIDPLALTNCHVVRFCFHRKVRWSQGCIWAQRVALGVLLDNPKLRWILLLYEGTGSSQVGTVVVKQPTALQFWEAVPESFGMMLRCSHCFQAMKLSQIPSNSFANLGLNILSMNSAWVEYQPVKQAFGNDPYNLWPEAPRRAWGAGWSLPCRCQSKELPSMFLMTSSRSSHPLKSRVFTCF